jgi:Ca2+-binding RTX toxin-like protein
VTENGANVLMTYPVGGARRLNPSPDPSWGLHLADMNIALGNLIDVVAAQEATYFSALAGACANTVDGDGGRDRLAGTPLSDLIRGFAGRDLLRGAGGDDCLRGQRGRDRLNGGAGEDELLGGGGNDRIRGRDGSRDKVECGTGRNDVARVDRRDRVRGCETVLSPG